MKSKTFWIADERQKPSESGFAEPALECFYPVMKGKGKNLWIAAKILPR